MELHLALTQTATLPFSLRMHRAGVMAKGASAYRSEFHSRCRTGVSEQLLLPGLHDEAQVNIGAETCGDLIRGVRDSLIRPDYLTGEVRFANAIFFIEGFSLLQVLQAQFSSVGCLVERVHRVWCVRELAGLYLHGERYPAFIRGTFFGGIPGTVLALMCDTPATM